MKNNKDLSCLEARLGYTFRDRSLLERALTHTSYSNENAVDSYERLEFLGDAVLQIIITDYLYHTFCKEPEGTLTTMRKNLVSKPPLARISEEISLGEYLSLGKGEEAAGGRHNPTILSDAFESIMAALYLDGGIAVVQEILLRLMKDELLQSAENKGADYKTRLQQLIEQDGCETLEYVVAKKEGPDHKPVYVINAVISGNIVGVGKGGSKHEAEQMAAREALSYFHL